MIGKAVRRIATQYNMLRNRCYTCGHRLSMHNPDGPGCSVVTNTVVPLREDNDTPCPCQAR